MKSLPAGAIDSSPANLVPPGVYYLFGGGAGGGGGFTLLPGLGERPLGPLPSLLGGGIATLTISYSGEPSDEVIMNFAISTPKARTTKTELYSVTQSHIHLSASSNSVGASSAMEVVASQILNRSAKMFAPSRSSSPPHPFVVSPIAPPRDQPEFIEDPNNHPTASSTARPSSGSRSHSDRAAAYVRFSLIFYISRSTASLGGKVNIPAMETFSSETVSTIPLIAYPNPLALCESNETDISSPRLKPCSLFQNSKPYVGVDGFGFSESPVSMVRIEVGKGAKPSVLVTRNCLDSPLIVTVTCSVRRLTSSQSTLESKG